MSDIKEYEDKMKKSVDSLKEDYTTIRAGRANPHILDKIKVDYYGTPTSLQQVANISVPEARMIQIQPWEASLIKDIEKAILVSDLGLTPNNDGKVIRLIFPELTEERRKELAKDVKKKGDNAKVAIRNVRRDANDTVKKENKAGELSDDEAKNLEDDVQKLTDKYIALNLVIDNTEYQYIEEDEHNLEPSNSNNSHSNNLENFINETSVESTQKSEKIEVTDGTKMSDLKLSTQDIDSSLAFLDEI